MTNPYYNATGNPGTRASGTSSTMRTEFAAIGTAFDKFATLSSNANKLVVVNAGETAQAVVPVTVDSSGNVAGVTSLALAAGLVASPALFPTGDTNTGIWFPAADTVAVSIAGAEGIRVNATGLGIGTNNPAQILDISKTQSASTVAVIRNGSTNASASAQFVVNADTASGRFAAYSSGAAGGLANALTIEQTTDNPILFYVNSAEAVRITGTCSFGINTGSPDTALHALANDGTSGGLSLCGSANASYVLLGNKDSGGSTGPVVLQVANREVSIGRGNSFTGIGAATQDLKIDSSGNLIHAVTGTAPTLGTNSTMSFELTSNTSLKMVVRGTDGVTRSVSLTLA